MHVLVNGVRLFFDVEGALDNFNFTGTFTGNAAADFMLGFPASLTTTTIETRTWVAGWRDGFFVLDNWQATPKLTLNYGLRYDLPTVPYSLNGYTRIMNASQTALLPVSSATSAAMLTSSASASGTSTSRGAVSRSIATSTLSPASTPAGTRSTPSRASTHPHWPP